MNNVRPMISNAIYQVSDNNGQTLMLTETTPEADPLTEIPGGTTLYVSDIQKGYGKTAYSGMTGWVRMSDLSLMGDETDDILVESNGDDVGLHVGGEAVLILLRGNILNDAIHMRFLLIKTPNTMRIVLGRRGR